MNTKTLKRINSVATAAQLLMIGITAYGYYQQRKMHDIETKAAQRNAEWIEHITVKGMPSLTNNS